MVRDFFAGFALFVVIMFLATTTLVFIVWWAMILGKSLGLE